MDRIPLTLLTGELRRAGVEFPPRYRALYNAAVDGRLPAARGSNGRWSVARADMPRIVEIADEIVSDAIRAATAPDLAEIVAGGPRPKLSAPADGGLPQGRARNRADLVATA